MMKRFFAFFLTWTMIACFTLPCHAEGHLPVRRIILLQEMYMRGFPVGRFYGKMRL